MRLSYLWLHTNGYQTNWILRETQYIILIFCHGTITALSHKAVKHLFNMCFIKYCQEPFYSGSGMPRSTLASLTCLTLRGMSCKRPDTTLLAEIRWGENIFVSEEPTTIDACTIECFTLSTDHCKFLLCVCAVWVPVNTQARYLTGEPQGLHHINTSTLT